MHPPRTDKSPWFLELIFSIWGEGGGAGVLSGLVYTINLSAAHFL
jgi:hypothetical protein